MRKRKYRITNTAKILILEFLLSSVGMLCGFTWRIQSESKKWDNLIYPGIKVANIDLSGKTKAEAKKLIQSQYIDPLLKNNTNVLINDKVYVLENSKLITNYDMDKVLNAAFNLGKNLNSYKKCELLKRSTTHQYNVFFEYNENYIKAFINKVEESVNKEPQNATARKINDGTIKITDDIKGEKIEEEKLEENIKKEINSRYSENIKIQVPIEKVAASILSSELSSIDTNISSFSTSFELSTDERAHNIELATSLINGKILMPQETFSFNDCVGERTKDRGFVEVPILEGNVSESGFNGGISQVSSTLYNAVLKAGIKPVERTHNIMPFSYVQLGLDAIVDWNNIDFKFKNTLKYPIYIDAYTQKKSLYVNIYSNSSLTKRKYDIISDVYETIKPDTKTINDSDLPEGQVSVVQTGYSGHKVKVKRDTYENGIVTSSDVISYDLYPPISSIVRQGAN
ncbi:VanW family protein [Clostridium magnum]|uniref:VanW like protein n=1 Tax=Clostridium magnum DSM 2767 TaxID=1121326 RepID=A0A162U3L6_9CLOT|nr:VanW family protein [Clostridium magnum]KZL93393.1 VanW like protein [Clostridium magnum DSM 2767]SHI15926.1 Vancomycin resistance protein YoaR, contains peptidoglycan-binding and VanW domains [Clostridium magnum DSM 2767]